MVSLKRKYHLRVALDVCDISSHSGFVTTEGDTQSCRNRREKVVSNEDGGQTIQLRRQVVLVLVDDHFGTTRLWPLILNVAASILHLLHIQVAYSISWVWCNVGAKRQVRAQTM